MKNLSLPSFAGWTLIWLLILPVGIGVKVILKSSLIMGFLAFIPFIFLAVGGILIGIRCFSRESNEIHMLMGLFTAIVIVIASIIIYFKINPVEQDAGGQLHSLRSIRATA